MSFRFKRKEKSQHLRFSHILIAWHLDKSSRQEFNTHILHCSSCLGCDQVQYKLSACHTVSFKKKTNLWLKDISSTMVLVRILLLSLFHMSLAGSQPTQRSQQASSPPHPAGEQSTLGTGNLSFPWSRLRLPRYPSG